MGPSEMIPGSQERDMGQPDLSPGLSPTIGRRQIALIGRGVYSSRRATIGSTLVARHAGIAVAANATAANNAGTPTKVARSMVLTPNNRLAITRVRSAAPATPAR